MAGARFALVTGASSGLGRATARRLMRDGWRVFNASLAPPPEPDDGVAFVEVDVRSDESVARGVARVLDAAGRVDLLVNNAGVLLVGPAEECTLDEARALFEVNFWGAVRTTNAVLPAMQVQRHGRIIVVGSLAGLVAAPGEAFYAASKAALGRYTEALRYEVAAFGIAVSLVEPGAFRTSLHGGAAAASRRLAAYDGVRERIAQTLAQNARRGAGPEHVARLIARIARVRRPRLRYPVGLDARWVPRLQRWAPDALFARAVARRFGL